MKKNKTLSLKHSNKILKQAYTLYNRKKKRLNISDIEKEHLVSLMEELHKAIQNKDKEKANELAHQLEQISQKSLKKTFFDYFIEIVFSLAFALIIAVVIRQAWFEFYTIPSGSMRPTYKENDFLMVSKTNFGINTLGKTSHFYFDPSLVKRGSCVVFSVANMDVPNSETTYFLIFPGTKQFIKRLIAKPGDTIYFYGGQIYGIDKDGNTIEEYQKEPWFTQIEHIPFIHFSGNVVIPDPPRYGLFSPVYIYQMGEPVAKMSVTPNNTVHSIMFPIPSKTIQNPKNFTHYFDLWGFENFATVRMLTQKQAKNWYPSLSTSNNPYYLEFTHHPQIDNAKVMKDEYNRLRPCLNYSTSLMPIDNNQLQKIKKHLYTARFIVKKQKAYRLGSSPYYGPILKNIPDGTYEFDNGEAYAIYAAGISKKLPPSHPLNNLSPHQIFILFNLGIEFNTSYLPNKKNQFINPSRYAYFYKNSLYLLGAKIFTKDELVSFIESQKNLTYPFIDNHPPLDKEFIKKYGLTIPDKTYLVLGDNHAMSGDSREFGFVPQSNLRGSPCFLIWPFGPRFGFPFQPFYSFFSFPNLFIWGLFILITLISIIYYRTTKNKPLKF